MPTRPKRIVVSAMLTATKLSIEMRANNKMMQDTTSDNQPPMIVTICLKVIDQEFSLKR